MKLRPGALLDILQHLPEVSVHVYYIGLFISQKLIQEWVYVHVMHVWNYHGICQLG